MMESQPVESTPIGPKIVRRITVTPGLRGGKPHILGRRITVTDVAFWHLEQGMPIEEMVSEFDLSLAQIHAASSYYYDHREEIDKGTAADAAFAAAVEKEYPSLLQEKQKSCVPDNRIWQALPIFDRAHGELV